MKTRFTNVACVLMSAALAALVSVDTSRTSASESRPKFSSTEYGFAARGEGWKALPGSPPPVDQDPRVRYVPNNTPGAQPTYRYADANNSNLTQWAKDHMKKDNDQAKGSRSPSRARPVLRALGRSRGQSGGTPIFFVQTPKVVYLIEEGDRQARRIYMNVPHSANPKPSWYGESVGKYEGDTLVIDTIGMNNKTFVDNFRTPHSEKLHVVERIRLVEGGDVLETELTIEDPDAC